MLPNKVQLTGRRIVANHVAIRQLNGQVNGKSKLLTLLDPHLEDCPDSLGTCESYCLHIHMSVCVVCQFVGRA